MSNTISLPLRQSGMSLMEVMVAMTLGLLLMIAIGTIYISSSDSYKVQDDVGRLQETGRMALEIISRSVRQAGFNNIPANNNPINSTAFGGTAIDGTDGADGAPDVLTIQYDGIENDRSCDNDLFEATDEADGDIIQDSININTATAELRCDGSIATAPAAPGNGTAILSNVEDFQVLYGVDTVDEAEPVPNVNQYTSAPDFGRVIAVKVCILVRSDNTGLVESNNQRYLNCNGALALDDDPDNDFTTAADTRLRRAFVTTINLRNRINIRPDN
ncbi:MAG: PilW family protein [Pseudomonadota bacterium]